ncbi:hypothetical protein F0562_007580 [Nyssa sinensis]|uniref:Beta-lactamase-related domain-containing protein n=1 Tax=Nyssa sinensis TaxID=561372 RepID=A0A5J5A3R0_9ASTE|nr:hypothetical protein F0562_007580 [Nyssa sinensis]
MTDKEVEKGFGSTSLRGDGLSCIGVPGGNPTLQISPVGNDAQIYDLCKRIRETKQKDMSVVEYYADLNGLNAEYDQIRSQVLGRDSFPTLRQAYAFVQQEESRKGVMLYAPAQDRFALLHGCLNTKRGDDKTGSGRPHTPLTKTSEAFFTSTGDVDHLISEELQVFRCMMARFDSSTSSSTLLLPTLPVQVCAYKDGEVIIDTAAGVLGRYDPRPVQPDSLFPVFSVTKGITAGMLHWLVDNGKLKLQEIVSNIWPEFGSNRKDLIKVHHVLNHTSGLHNALASLTRENPLLMSDWDECLKHIATSVPETEPGHEQLYHYLSFGWLCGGIIEHASRKKFQEILEEAFIHPLNIEGELYIGIPPGVESRLATLMVDMDDLNNLSGISSAGLPSTFQPGEISQLVTTLPLLFNMLNVRRAIIPAANGHCSARALARYYATLVDGGVVPPPHPSSSKPALGSHTHVPKFPSQKTAKKQKGRNSKELAAVSKGNNTSECSSSDGKKASSDNYIRVGNDSSSSSSSNNLGTTESVAYTGGHCKIFNNPRIHDAFMGTGEYEKLVFPNGKFGLGFRRLGMKDGSLVGFGHSGMGGSTGYCDIKNRFAIAVTLNKMSFGAVTANIIRLVCSELDIPLPEEFSRYGERGSDMQLNLDKALLN